MKASDLFIKALENEGVRTIFGVPGEENLDFLESLRSSKIELVLTRHEQAAAFMAATYGRLTGNPGVCLSTLGPGATNFVTGTAYAQLGGMPLILISGQKPIKTSKQGRFQILNTVEMMAPLCKMSKQIVEGATIPYLVREAFRVAQEEKPGAVYLELPEDIAGEQVAETALFTPSLVRRPAAEAWSISKAVEMLQQAKRPLVLIAAGANRNRTAHALETLVNKTGMYFVNTQMGKGVIDERHPLYLGTAALSAKDYVHCAIDRADLILNVGHDVVEKPPFFMEHGGKKVIHINHFTAQVDPVYFPQLEIIGDIASSIEQLTEAAEASPNWDLEYFGRVKEELEGHMNDGAEDTRFPIIPQKLVATVRKTIPDDAMVTLDNGMYKIWFARNFKAYQAKSLLLDNALATMGAGLPSAMACKFFHPGRTVISICGDGGFMMNSQEIETAVRLKLHLIVLILRDNAYGMIKWKQASMGFADYGLDYGNPDFVRYAESYGAKGHRVQAHEQLGQHLQAAMQESAVHIIEVPVDYSENDRVLTKELEEKTCLL